VTEQSTLKIAVFIDFDNIEIGVKSTMNQSFDVGAVLEAVKERGEVITKMAYGDWKRTGDYSRMMTQHAVRMVQRNMTPGGDKNGADINLALDALEMAFTHAHINAFVIVGGDSDFISLVEKLKQYDRKVFVVGGRQFTSAVMQKNCTEFIAYENLIRQPSRRQSSGGGRERGGTPAPAPAPLTTAPIGKAFPLVTRALQVMTDREVTPQLGLLKSTLLQLDSSFSERDYGASSFREFADKLAESGLVTLRSSGRSVLVDLREASGDGEAAGHAEPPAHAVDAHVESHVESHADAHTAEPHAESPLPQPDVESETADAAPHLSFADGVALLRRVLGTPGAVQRWPMYIRNVKQILRAADPTFDERKHGNLVELLRAVQREGLVRLDRDRQGVMRVFQGLQLRVGPPSGLGLPVEDPALEHEAAMARRASGDDERRTDDVAAGTLPDDESPAHDGETSAPAGEDAGSAPATLAGSPAADASADDTPEPAARPKRRRKTPTPDGETPATPTAARKPRARSTTTRKKKDKVTE
jgi:uncharacterized LabA/DUF88 family protein